jgi:hypothetical protein
MGGFSRRLAAILAGVLGATTVVIGASGPATAQDARPPGQDLTITPGDLAFVLQQIQIGEAHARRVVQEDPNRPSCSSSSRRVSTPTSSTTTVSR